MDWIVSLPYIAHGYNTVYTIVDQFNKLVRFILYKININTEEPAYRFFEHWIYQLGIPQRITSDHNTQFTSQLWQ